MLNFELHYFADDGRLFTFKCIRRTQLFCNYYRVMSLNKPSLPSAAQSSAIGLCVTSAPAAKQLRTAFLWFTKQPVVVSY
jgi:hypothetical protein